MSVDVPRTYVLGKIRRNIPLNSTCVGSFEHYIVIKIRSLEAKLASAENPNKFHHFQKHSYNTLIECINTIKEDTTGRELNNYCAGGMHHIHNTNHQKKSNRGTSLDFRISLLHLQILLVPHRFCKVDNCNQGPIP